MRGIVVYYAAMKHLAFLTWAALLAFLPCRAEGVLRTAAELLRYADGEPTDPATFSVTGTVVRVQPPGRRPGIIFLKDDTGIARIIDEENPLPVPGDIISASGQVSFCPVGNASLFTNNVISVIGHATPSKPTAIPLAKLDPHLHNFHVIDTEGTVVDVIYDEITDKSFFLLLKDGEAEYPVIIKKKIGFDSLRYLEARIRIRGMFFCRASAYRTYSGPYIEPDDMSIITPPPTDPFAAPQIQYYPLMTPQEIANLPRRSEVGYVLATWNGNRFAMRTPKGKIVLVQMLSGVPLPENNAAVKVVGYPTTDLFRINLTRAITRPEPSLGPIDAETPESVDVEHLTMDGIRPTPDAVRFYHGRAIRYRGTVKEANDSGTPNSSVLLNLKTGSATTTVNAGASGLDLSAIPVGSEVEVAGVCVLEGENWTSERIFPHIKGFMTVLRTAGDLAIVRNPPWWTTGRLFAAILIMLAGMVAVVFWNRYLKRLVNRRGNELAREKFKKESAVLKIGERTRLAVELHDSLSQNLEGVACQIAATRTIMETNHDAAEACLGTAQRMLDSCRLELKRCLFDLRGNALEAKGLSDAIRTTLKPICDGVELAVRFDIRRSHFDDTTVHATLCIIRELVSNAIRHGRATKIRVAGEYHDGTLSFSVGDNGCGFDPSAAPGPSLGHFGLEGIRERTDRLDGAVKIESEPGRGTKVNVKLKVKS